MKPEQIRARLGERTRGVTAKELTDLMFEHWERIDQVLCEKGEIKPRWELCW